MGGMLAEENDQGVNSDLRIQERRCITEQLR